jgi:hypothetical protein
MAPLRVEQSFLECHAKYLTYDELVKRRDSGEWDPNAVR